jgi:hypothetical protein
MLSLTPLSYVLVTMAMVGAIGLMVQGVWTLVARRVPQPLVRLRGDVIARQPVRLGGFQLLLGAALVMSMTNFLRIPYGLGVVMIVAACAAIVAAAVWYAVRRD